VWKQSCFVPLRAQVKKCGSGGNYWSGDVWKESCFVPLRARRVKCRLGGKYWSIPEEEVSPSFYSESVSEASMVLKASLFLKLEEETSKSSHTCILLQKLHRITIEKITILVSTINMW
jgi:hypothetical protein